MDKRLPDAREEAAKIDELYELCDPGPTGARAGLEKAIRDIQYRTLMGAARVALSEKVNAKATGTEEDKAYNMACYHVNLALKRLATSLKEGK